MFLTFKKKNLLIFTLLTAFLLIFAVTLCTLAKGEETSIGAKQVIVVDAGHGGVDGGVEGTTTGVSEAEINLAIAKNLQTYLQDDGYRVVMTRTNSDGLYGLTTSNKKSADMSARKRIIQDAEPDLVISIHQNYFPSPTVSGAQVFYAPNSPLGKEYAETMQNILNASLSCDRTSAIGDYYILQCTDYTSLLCECGFLSNYEEEKLLVTGEYQQKVAYTIFSSIDTIFS